MYIKQKMVFINGEEIKKALKENSLTAHSVSEALGKNKNFITNAINRNKISEDALNDFCTLTNTTPNRFTANGRFVKIMNEYEAEEEPVVAKKDIKASLKPQEGPIETRTGKILQGVPKMKFDNITAGNITSGTINEEALKSDENVYEKRWSELKKAVAQMFVDGNEIEITDVIGIITKIERIKE